MVIPVFNVVLISDKDENAIKPFSAGILWKIGIKKKQNSQLLQTVISQKLGRIQSQNWNFLKVNSIFFKTALFFACSTHVSTWQGTPPLQLPVLLLAARNAQKVNNGKHLVLFDLSKFFDKFYGNIIRYKLKWAISFKYQFHLYLPRFQNYDFQYFLGVLYLNW